MSNVKPTYISSTDGLPKPVDTSADSISANAVYVQTSATPDTTVGISRDLSDNLVLTDAVTGTKTLAELAVSGGPDAGQREPVVARYDFTGTPGPTVPTAPAAPTFSGTEYFVGSGGGEYATLALAVAAASPGDIITVRAGYTTTETSLTTVNVNKSLEIRGEDRATSGISGVAGSAGGNFLITIAAGVNDVWIHDLTITNNVTAAQDPGGISANIAGGGMTQTFPAGSTGLRFERLNLIHWKFGISIQGNGWVINDCAFSCRLATAATTIRHIGHYGQTGDCFITNCVMTPTTDPTPRSQGIYMTTNFPGVGTYRPGQAGNLIIQNLTQSGSGNWNAYYLQDVLHEPGAATGSGYNSPATPGSFGLWLDNVAFTTSYSGNPFSLVEATGTVEPLSFFSNIYLNNVTGQARTAGDNKGFLAVAGSTGTGRNIGAPTVGFWVLGTNTFNSILPSTTYAEGSTVDDLLGVLTTNYAVPSPLLAPTTPVTVPSGTLMADGVALNAGDRVMLVNTTDNTYGGIYEVQSGMWTRAPDMAAGANAAGYYWWVLGGGNIYGGTAYVVANPPAFATVGTDFLGFVRTDFKNAPFSSPTDGQLLIGDSSFGGYQLAALTAGSNVTITNGPGTITIAASGGGGGVSSVTASSPLTSSGGATPDISLTGTVAIANGGTGTTTAPSDGKLLIGKTDGSYAVANLTAGSNVTITDGDGTITIAASGGGGGLTNWTEAVSTSAPNATVPVTSFTATNAATNVDAALVAKGAGASVAQVPDGTATGGNKRGQHATDWQKTRGGATQVASGQYSTLGGGEANTASGLYSTVGGGVLNNATNVACTVDGGEGNTASGQYSTVGGGNDNTAGGAYSIVSGGFQNSAGGTGGTGVIAGGGSNQITGYSPSAVISGGQNNYADSYNGTIPGGGGASTRGTIGKLAFASFGSAALLGKEQLGAWVSRASSTDTTPVLLTAEGTTPPTFGSTICLLPNQSAYVVTAQVIGRDTTTGDVAAFEVRGVVKRAANAGTTAIVGAPTTTAIAADAGAAAWTCTLVANTTYGGVLVQATGSLGSTVKWVATLYTTELVA